MKSLSIILKILDHEKSKKVVKDGSRKKKNSTFQYFFLGGAFLKLL